MSEILTMEEIEKKFDGEWVLIEDVETDEKLEVLRGKVVFHGNDKDELHQKADEIEKRSYCNALHRKTRSENRNFLLNFKHGFYENSI